jgi:hypothetical protein
MTRSVHENEQYNEYNITFIVRQYVATVHAMHLYQLPLYAHPRIYHHFTRSCFLFRRSPEASHWFRQFRGDEGRATIMCPKCAAYMLRALSTPDYDVRAFSSPCDQYGRSACATQATLALFFSTRVLGNSKFPSRKQFSQVSIFYSPYAASEAQLTQRIRLSRCSQELRCAGRPLRTRRTFPQTRSHVC